MTDDLGAVELHEPLQGLCAQVTLRHFLSSEASYHVMNESNKVRNSLEMEIKMEAKTYIESVGLRRP